MASPRTLVVVNPRSQGGTAGKRWPLLAERIRRHFPFEEAITAGPGHATILTRDALTAGVERVIALGGDGTVNEVVNGFFAEGAAIRPEASFGLLPFGTGGDFRRTLNIPTNLDDAAALIAANQRRHIDVGQLDFTTRDGSRSRRMFANITSFGVSGVVDRLVNESSKRLGRLAFAVATARATWSYQNQRVHLRFDDDPADTVDVTVNTVAIANARYFGGAMKVAPDAEVDDGAFDVVVIGDMGIRELLLHGGRLYKGTHLTLDKVSHRRARVVDAEPTDPGATVELDVDGENLGRLPARFTLLPRSLWMIAPPA
jgi:YegS/Rv2252/BmrU family lipid kinase